MPRQTTKSIRDRLLRVTQPEVLTDAHFVSTGSSLLDLACSGNVFRGLPIGYYYLLVGDSNSGKSWVSHSIFAEAHLKKSFDKYALIYNQPEYGALFDVGKFFGSGVQDRIVKWDENRLDHFFYQLDDLLSKQPAIIVTDSMDAMIPKEDEDHFQESKTAAAKGKDAKGSFHMAKAKQNKFNLGRLTKILQDTGSMLIVTAQSRDNMKFGTHGKTRSGGDAMTFYATIEIWTSIRSRIKKKVNGKDREVGILSRMEVKRTRVTGKDRVVEVPIYNTYGIDDIGSCVDYLMEEKYWSVDKDGDIRTSDFNNGRSLHLSREELIKYIDKEGELPLLKKVVQKCWDAIEAECALDREPRYR